jgi:hypothetical protein
MPAATALALPWELDGFDCALIDLAERRWLEPRLGRRDGRTVLELSSAAADSLFVASRKG